MLGVRQEWKALVLGVCATVLSATSTAKAEVTGASLVGTVPGSGVSAVFATHAPGRPDELFVVDQRGMIQILNLQSGEFNSTPFLNITSLVDDAANEQGLLGLAFDPDFVNNGYFYVNYTRDPGPGPDLTQIERYQLTDPLTDTLARTRSRTPVLDFEQDFSNHNGGWIGFSPNDGYLYIATGDGGSGDDPNNRGQSLNTRLGKILRVDVHGDDFPADSTENYAVPADNPFVDGSPGTLDDIWAFGLRNPYRASFDRQTGDLWIGDVGQLAREEINFQPADSPGGENYGWRLREGDIATPTGGVGGPEPPGHVGPVYDYVSNGSFPFGGEAVIGGYVYRGADPEVRGRYFFADSNSSRLWSFEPSDPDGTVQNIESLLDPGNDIFIPTSFGEDADGNVYVIARGGGVFRIDTSIQIPGDYDGSGTVDADDYAEWRSRYGQSGGLAADGNGDGVVDAADYTVWRDNLGRTSTAPTAAAAPEPAAAALLMLASAATAARRRPQRRAATLPR
ncbi:Quinoprotein glucose dehydrogenase B precursor [Posidoniimonas corsicana]|uniref:Quinoprotein glucose dehydrogenase B n=1 Tax=Posidoniimonas corsicana TaxID=1938618 RepID=A0A5C5VE70_9BACT|nr:PQQ-dependent sugar dehydrogenase [Posidoniimonas corsicana]TWT36209.1 Quinoprotein glucose dehydrogenase B precursor [Posidoniimonas corsicana]